MHATILAALIASLPVHPADDTAAQSAIRRGLTVCEPRCSMVGQPTVTGELTALVDRMIEEATE